jgi:RNA polymerase sigma-70 factor (ECF subfamily)
MNGSARDRHDEGHRASGTSLQAVLPDRSEVESMVSPANGLGPTQTATEDLMLQVQKGDMLAFQELVRLYQRKIFRVISGYHRDPEDAMEVLQDTFLKVYTARDTWERRNSFAAWIYRIAINASIDRYRRAERNRTAPLDEMVEDRVHESATRTPDLTPIERLRAGERRRLLEQAVRRLPMRQREVLSLRYFAEMQLEEIAAALGCPLGTVKSNLHKAVLALKSMLLEKKEVLSYD